MKKRVQRQKKLEEKASKKKKMAGVCVCNIATAWQPVDVSYCAVSQTPQSAWLCSGSSGRGRGRGRGLVVG